MKHSQPTSCRLDQLHLSNWDAHYYISAQLSHLLSTAIEGSKQCIDKCADRDDGPLEFERRSIGHRIAGNWV